MEIYFEDEDLEELIFTGMNRKYKKYSRDRKFMENLIDVYNYRVERLLFRELENGICITIIELNTTHYGNKK